MFFEASKKVKLFGHTCCVPGSGSSTAVSSEERHYEDIEEMREAVKNLSVAAASTASAASPSVGQVWPLRQFISVLFGVKCIPGGPLIGILFTCIPENSSLISVSDFELTQCPSGALKLASYVSYEPAEKRGHRQARRRGPPHQ